MPNVESQDEFVVELIKSLNAMVDPKDRNKFSNIVSDDQTYSNYV